MNKLLTVISAAALLTVIAGPAYADQNEKTVFVTSAKFKGNLGGLTGATVPPHNKWSHAKGGRRTSHLMIGEHTGAQTRRDQPGPQCTRTMSAAVPSDYCASSNKERSLRRGASCREPLAKHIPGEIHLSKVTIEHETQRIEFLIERDGPKATRAWIERTLAIYREAVKSPKSHAPLSDYLPSSEAWLKNNER